MDSRQGRLLVVLSLLFVASPAPALAFPGTETSSGIERLGNNVMPSMETLQLNLDPRKDDYSGVATIEVEVKSATDTVRFTAKNMTLHDVTLASKMGSKSGPAIPLTATADDQGIVTAVAKTHLTPGMYTLTVPFSNPYDRRANALYKVIVDGESYLFTDFEPADARAAWPCFDEPSFKIPWRVSMTVPSGDKVVGNMPIARQKKSDKSDATNDVAFEETPPLPSYLIAVAVGPLEFVPVTGMDIPGNIVTVKGRAAFATEAARQFPKLVTALEGYFGMKFPFPKCDLLAVPEFYAGAMENAGAVTFREEILLLDPKTSTPRQQARMASTIAHELSHMWFGDYVTLAWWDDVWLNESFASWLGDKTTFKVFPQFANDLKQVHDVQRAMATDARPSTRVIRSLGNGKDQSLNRLFDPLAYQKGQAVLQMFEAWIGPDVFRQGVGLYLHEHAWGNARGDDLWRALSRASGHDVGKALSGYLDQPGVPLVTADIEPDGKIKLKQERFHNYGATVTPSHWQIPVLLKYEAVGRAHTKWVLLTDDEQTFSLPDAAKPTWLDPNGNESGYYRWSVPGSALVDLAANAQKNLNARERIGFIANAGALLDAGLLRGDEYLRILSQFSSDTEPEVTQSQIEGLTKVRDTFVEKEDRPAFAAYVRQTLEPVLGRIGMRPKPGESDGVTGLRPVLLQWLGDDGNDKAVQDFADSLGRVYRSNPGAIDGSLADVAVRLPATRGDAALYETYRQHLEQAKLPVDRARWLTGMGSFYQDALVDSALAYALRGALRPQERGNLTRSLMEHKDNHPKLFAWMMANREEIIAQTTPTAAAMMPTYAGGCDTQRLEQAKAFFAAPEHQAPGVNTTLAQVSDAVTDCSNLKEREGGPVRAFLHQVATAK
jgi:alanyl aminopeptidase